MSSDREELVHPTGAFPQPQRALLPDAIADSIAEAIATRHLRPGERVVETALAQRFSVSRVPVREALKILHTQGILQGENHKGYRVSSFGPQKAEQVFEVRLALETILLRDAIDLWHRGEEDHGLLDFVIEEMRTAARSGSVREMLRADLDFHRTICRAARNEVAGALWNAIARHVLIIFNLARYNDVDLSVPVHRHEELRDFIFEQVASPDPKADLRAVLEGHFLPRRPRGAEEPMLRAGAAPR